MKSFKHINARTVDETCALLREYKGKAILNAGGTDLLSTLKGEYLLNYPEAVINIKTIPGLDDIKEGSKGLRIGALTTLSNIAGSSVVKEKYKVLAEAAYAVATPQIRNMATLAGNLCQEVRCWYYRYPHAIGGRLLCLRKGSGPCLAVSGDNRYHAILGGKGCFAVCPSDTAVALTALNAVMKIAGARKNRIVPVKDFFTTLGNVLQPGEIVTEIQIPKPLDEAKQTFLRLTLRRPVDFAIVSVACVISLESGMCEDASIALGAVAPMPIKVLKAERILKGKPLESRTAEEAAEAAVVDAKPLSMNAYKIEETKVLVRRAILQSSS
jgi:xanthine dehydrogenase YagS FAD-binding subunit